jgi:hypothetical protein
LAEKLPFEFKDMHSRLQNSDSAAFWSYFITQYNFLTPYLAELLLKISIDKKGVPYENQEIIDFGKKNFSKSKHYLSFFTNE